MQNHPVLENVLIGYSPVIDAQRSLWATRLTVFPERGAPVDAEALLAVLAPRATLRPLVAQLEDAGLHLQAIDIAETALRNLCGRCEPPGRAQALRTRHSR